MFSEALAILDRNTEKYMIEEMKEELDAIKQEIGETKQELGETKQELGETKQELGETKQELGETKQELGEAKQELGEKNQTIQELVSMNAVKDRELGEKESMLERYRAKLRELGIDPDQVGKEA